MKLFYRNLYKYLSKKERSYFWLDMILLLCVIYLIVMGFQLQLRPTASIVFFLLGGVSKALHDKWYLPYFEKKYEGNKDEWEKR